MDKLFKQYNIHWLGSFMNVLYLTTPIIGLGSIIMNAATMYATVVIPYIKPFLPWFDFWVFAIVATLFICFMVFIVWKFVHQSFFSNPIKQEVQKNREMLIMIMDNLGIKYEK